MIEHRKKSLLNIILSGDTPQLDKISNKEYTLHALESKKLKELRTQRQTLPPKLIVNREENGVRVNLQPFPPTPKFETLAFVANSGKITYYKGENYVKPEYKRKIEALSRQMSLGKFNKK